jgi:hypothetical protein
MFQSYFKTVQQLYLSDNESSEHTYRTALENLLQAFEKEYIKRNLNVKQEPKKQEDKGRPDFKVTTQEQLTIGFVETKKIGEDLKKILNSKQLENYKQLSDNIILTDYLQFYIINKGELVFDSSLFYEINLSNTRFKLEKYHIEKFTQLLKMFFESKPDPIFKTQDLAMKLSEKAKFLREYCNAELDKENDDTNLLQGLYKAFGDTLLPLLDTQYFADIYAQTLTYGLFLAALNCDDARTLLNKNTAYSLLPNTFPLIKELFHRLDDFPAEIIWSVDEIISILKVTDFAAIKKEFVEYRHKEQGFNDPFIFFYEDFLKHYDKTQRELRGVYYTPEPVVSFIVRSIEIILKDTFGLNDGFINKDVTLLDFATGTGTFLLHSFRLALEQAQKIGDKQTVNMVLNEQIINNFYGFELLVAPYVIAHLKISEYLKEQGYSIEPGKRLNIYLTNTLTNKEPQPFPTMPALSKEGKEANKIKNKDILVILGNPPYSGHSANKGDWIQEKMKEYYQVDGQPLGEKNPKWLQDDYVKFIRFAQWKMENIDHGIVGIITNHSYLDNPTFRGMRQSLMKSFDEIYILDLHGNSKKKEKCPDGSKDENIFDIQQGVAIAFFIKKNKKQKKCKIFQGDLFGMREIKYLSLFDSSINNLIWNEIHPNSPFYLFKSRTGLENKEYFLSNSIKDIFNFNSNGIISKRDRLVVNFNGEEIISNLKEFLNPKNSDLEISQKFSLSLIDKDKWNLSKTRQYLIKNGINDKCLKLFDYRPFDKRYIYYDDVLVARTVRALSDNLQSGNIGLVCGRAGHNVGSNLWNLLYIVDSPIDLNLFYRGGATTFPLYIYQNNGNNGTDLNGNNFLFNEDGKKDNFTKDFRKYIKTKYKASYTPEQILGYIYAVLHSPTYRTKYIEFLKIDFPRVPFTDDEKLFKELSNIGEKLIASHLMKEIPSEIDCRLLGEGTNYKVELVKYEKGKIWFNKERYFDNVSEEVWNYYIGGYQVLDKWLKERKKHEITLEIADIRHFQDVVNILAYTIKTMNKIDDLTKDWI